MNGALLDRIADLQDQITTLWQWCAVLCVFAAAMISQVVLLQRRVCVLETLVTHHDFVLTGTRAADLEADDCDGDGDSDSRSREAFEL